MTFNGRFPHEVKDRRQSVVLAHGLSAVCPRSRQQLLRIWTSSWADCRQTVSFAFGVTVTSWLCRWSRQQRICAAEMRIWRECEQPADSPWAKVTECRWFFLVGVNMLTVASTFILFQKSSSAARGLYWWRMNMFILHQQGPWAFFAFEEMNNTYLIDVFILTVKARRQLFPSQWIIK